jgi:hypothetical protein
MKLRCVTHAHTRAATMAEFMRPTLFAGTLSFGGQMTWSRWFISRAKVSFEAALLSKFQFMLPIA